MAGRGKGMTRNARKTNQTKITRERKENTYVGLDPAVRRAIDAERGQIPLSTYINDFLWYAFVATDDQVEKITNF